MGDIANLISDVVAFRDARGWAKAHTPENLAKSITIEAAELLELFQWHPPTSEIIINDADLRIRISEELADILIYAFSFADRTNIDIAEAIQDKLAKNAKKYPLHKQ